MDGSINKKKRETKIIVASNDENDMKKLSITFRM